MGYFTYTFEGGVNFPLGLSNEILNIGVDPLFHLHYNMAWQPFTLGIGFGTGGNYNQTREDYLINYKLYSIPILLSIKLELSLNIIHFAVRIGGGGAFHIQEYHTTGINNIYAMKPMGSTSFIINLSITESWRVGCYGRFVVHFFDDNIIVGMSPGLQIYRSF